MAFFGLVKEDMLVKTNNVSFWFFLVIFSFTNIMLWSISMVAVDSPLKAMILPFAIDLLLAIAMIVMYVFDMLKKDS